MGGREALLTPRKCSIVWAIQDEEKADDRIRTYDLLITNQLLYRLSYVGEKRRQGW